MKAILLKIQVLFFVSCLLSQGVQAQNPRFIYIQTDNKEPFYVKIDKRLLNSSATGYIIIAKLLEDNYQFSIGFPDNVWPELNVTVSVKDANTGFLLKRSGDKGWAMFNLITMKSMAVEKQRPPVKEVETVSSTDEFARILAEVVDDPSIARVIVEKKTGEAPVKTGNDKTVNIPVVQEEIKAIAVSQTEIVSAPADTVAKKVDVVKKDANKGMINSNCKRSASDNDYWKLRKIMIAADNEKNMTKAATRQFITTCYTTEQVKNLGILFITEEEKYKFFVAAFPHVSDTGNFRILEDQLSEDYYKTRFKAMFSH